MSSDKRSLTKTKRSAISNRSDEVLHYYSFLRDLRRDVIITTDDCLYIRSSGGKLTFLDQEAVVTLRQFYRALTKDRAELEGRMAIDQALDEGGGDNVIGEVKHVEKVSAEHQILARSALFSFQQRWRLFQIDLGRSFSSLSPELENSTGLLFGEAHGEQATIGIISVEKGEDQRGTNFELSLTEKEITPKQLGLLENIVCTSFEASPQIYGSTRYDTTPMLRSAIERPEGFTVQQSIRGLRSRIEFHASSRPTRYHLSATNHVLTNMWDLEEGKRALWAASKEQVGHTMRKPSQSDD